MRQIFISYRETDKWVGRSPECGGQSKKSYRGLRVRGKNHQRDVLKSPSDNSKSNAASAYGNLGWIRLLNNDVEGSIRASLEALKWEPGQALAQSNLAHAYLLSGETGKARKLYQASRGEEVNGDIAENSVFDDHALLRKLGLSCQAMAEMEKVLGK